MREQTATESDIVELDEYRRRRAGGLAERAAKPVVPTATWWAVWVVWYPMWVAT